MLLICFCICCGEKKSEEESTEKPTMHEVKLMTLDPGHFHAALVQKTMYPQVDSIIHVFAPEGAEVRDFLSKIEQYNTRAEHPTSWKVNTNYGDDYLQQMIAQKPGNVMVVAGKNSKKIE